MEPRFLEPDFGGVIEICPVRASIRIWLGKSPSVSSKCAGPVEMTQGGDYCHKNGCDPCASMSVTSLRSGIGGLAFCRDTRRPQTTRAK